jgi:predicted regulator of Ras-like GTPase activity (Roadblock/LC7/MglB family)
MDIIEKAETALRVCLELPDDIEADELRREATNALGLAERGCSQISLRDQLAQMHVNRMQQLLDLDGCDQAAAAIIELADAHRS